MFFFFNLLDVLTGFRKINYVDVDVDVYGVRCTFTNTSVHLGQLTLRH